MAQQPAPTCSATKDQERARLSESLSDARLLVNYLALSGKLEDKTYVEPVLKAQEELD